MNGKKQKTGIRLALTGALVLSGFGAVQGAIIDTSIFTYRAPVTFPGYTLDDTLANFPVLVRLTETEGGFSYGDSSADGSDIRFALEDGTLLPSEVALWNPEGESQIWVAVPALAVGAEIRMYWGGEHAFPASQTDGTVWSTAGYFGVWHMDEASGATTAKDSAGGAMEGTYNVTATGEDGKAGRSVRISNGGWNVADGKGITTAPFSNIGDQFTFTLWTKYPNQNPGTDRLGSTKTDWTATTGWEVSTQRYNQQTIDMRASGTANATPPVTLKNTDWQYLTFVFNGNKGTTYVQNSWKKEGDINAQVDSEHAFTIGNMAELKADSFKGWMDEVRLYKGVQTRNWISTEYNSINDANFAAVGMAESLATEDPILGEVTLDSVESHTATIGWQLNSAGGSAADIALVYGVESGVYTVTNTLAEALTDRTSDVATLAGLTCGTTYYAKVIADNGTAVVTSAQLTFTTSGAPVFSDVSLVVTDGTATATATLAADVETANVSATCLFGKRLDTPVELASWEVATSPATLTATKTELGEGHYRAHFEATSTCSVCGKSVSQSSEEVAASIAGEYEWTGEAGDSCWHTPGNWSLVDIPASGDTIVFGMGVGTDLVVTFAEEGEIAGRLIRVTGSTPFTLGTAAGPAIPAIPIELTTGAGLVTIDAKYDLTADATLTVAANAELDIRSVSGIGNLILDGEGTVKMLEAGSRTAGNTEVRAGELLISADKQLGKELHIGGHGKEAAARSNRAFVGTRPFGIDDNKTFVLDKGTFDLESDGLTDHWEKEHCGPISVAKGGTFLPGKRRVQFETAGGVVNLEISGTIEGGVGGQINFDDNTNFIVTESASAPVVVKPNVTVKSNTFRIEDIPGAPVDVTIIGSVGFGWASRDGFKKTGAGVLRLTGQNTYGGDGTISDRQGATQLREGMLLVDNDPTVYGSGTGNSLVLVDGGTVLGGTGRIGGLTDPIKTWSGTGNGEKTCVLAKGTADRQAVVWPGTIDAEGGHANGTLTVGIDEVLDGEEEKRTLHHPVTFGDYSTLKVSFGAAQNEFDALVVNGAVDISATGTRLEMAANGDPAKILGGTFTVLKATDGITGVFADTVRPEGRKWRVDYVSEVPEEGGDPVVTEIQVFIARSLAIIIR